MRNTSTNYKGGNITWFSYVIKHSRGAIQVKLEGYLRFFCVFFSSFANKTKRDFWVRWGRDEKLNWLFWETQLTSFFLVFLLIWWLFHTLHFTSTRRGAVEQSSEQNKISRLFEDDESRWIFKMHVLKNWTLLWFENLSIPIIGKFKSLYYLINSQTLNPLDFPTTGRLKSKISNFRIDKIRISSWPCLKVLIKLGLVPSSHLIKNLLWYEISSYLETQSLLFKFQVVLFSR